MTEIGIRTVKSDIIIYSKEPRMRRVTDLTERNCCCCFMICSYMTAGQRELFLNFSTAVTATPQHEFI